MGKLVNPNDETGQELPDQGKAIKHALTAAPAVSRVTSMMDHFCGETSKKEVTHDFSYLRPCSCKEVVINLKAPLTEQSIHDSIPRAAIRVYPLHDLICQKTVQHSPKAHSDSGNPS